MGLWLLYVTAEERKTKQIYIVKKHRIPILCNCFHNKKQKTTAISFNMVPKNGNYISTRIILFLGANVMQGMMCPCIIG